MSPGTPNTARRPAGTAPHEAAQQPERLQKVLARAGYGSRRACEELISAGRVEVDRQVVQRLGTAVDPATQEIRVDGEAIRRTAAAYYLLHKPVGVVCTNRDPSGRPRATDLVPPTAGRLFTVGRLDLASEGLILLTNDGDLAHQLTHPRYGVEKTYLVTVAGHPEAQHLAALRQGVRLAEGWARVASVRVKNRRKQSTQLEIVLAEGRNREIRRLLASVGHKVQRLVRIAVGPLRLADLPSGAYRRLTWREIDDLKKCTRPQRRRRSQGSAADSRRPPPAPRRPRR